MANKTNVEVTATTQKSKAKSATKSIGKSTPVSPKSVAESGSRVAVSKAASKKAAESTRTASAKGKTASKAASVKVAASASKPASVKTAKPAAAKNAKKTTSARTAEAVSSERKARSSGAMPTGVTRSVAASVAEKAAKKISAPVRPASPKAAVEKTTPQTTDSQPKKSVSARHGFKTNEYVVYPAHGVGCIIGIEEQEIAGMALELFVINFEKEKLTLRVPTGKLESVGMRKLADESVVKKAMDVLKGRARVKRTMWSRRAQEYVAKINSGDLVSIAEVVRDLYRSEAQPEQSYSERQLYEDALDRMAREIAAVEKLDERGAMQRITDVLSKSAKSRRAAAEEAAADEDTHVA